MRLQGSALRYPVSRVVYLKYNFKYWSAGGLLGRLAGAAIRAQFGPLFMRTEYRGVETLMSDDIHDDTIDLADPSEYEDLVSQRVMAFCHLAKLADTIRDETVKDLCLTMLRKLNSSIRTPSTAELRSIEGGPRSDMA